jgi:hypothetical protein
VALKGLKDRVRAGACDNRHVVREGSMGGAGAKASARCRRNVNQ